MSQRYFQRINQLTETRFWINNPTMTELDKAIREGAVACTTNPAYSSKMFPSAEENEAAMAAVDEAIRVTPDDTEAAVLVQRKLVQRLAQGMLPVYRKNPGKQGFVSIQGNPHAEEDPDNIIREALEDRKLAENIIAKIPVTESGLKAIEYLVGQDMPIIATEIMGLSQAASACETYRRASAKSGKTPAFYVTHITGIFDDHLRNVVKQDGINIEGDVLWQAGCIVARRQYHLLKERNYAGIMLGGGARGLHHFTELVGGDMQVTINWRGTADKLLETDPPVVYRMDTPTPRKVIDELMEKLPDFKKAYLEDGLTVPEYMDFGPVVLFRNSFIKGWDALEQIIAERRKNR